jgi:hypothetical protein
MLLSSRAITLVSMALAAIGGAYVLWLVLSQAGEVAEMPPQISGVVRAGLAGLGAAVIMLAGLAIAKREAVREIANEMTRLHAQRLAEVERVASEVVRRELRAVGTPDEIAARVALTMPTAEQMAAHLARVVPTAEQTAVAIIRAMPTPAPQRVYVSRAEITAEVPRMTALVDPDVIQLGERLTRRIRRDDE